MSANAIDNRDIEQAIALLRQGAVDAAQAACVRMLGVDPDNSDVLNLMSAAALKKGDHRAALKYVLDAITANDDVPIYHANLGAILIALSRYEDAIIALQSCLALEPDNLAGLINLADALNRIDRFNEAIDVSRRAVDQAPDHPDALNNFGIALKGVDLRDDAQKSFERALAVRPDHADTWNSLGVLLMGVGDVDGAIDALREAVRCSPAHAQAHFGLGMCLLARGDFEEGAREYEWRWATREFRPRDFDAPKWDGSDPRGKTLLLYAEQGFGDVVQFVRFASTLADRGARVLIEVQPELADLVAGVTGVWEIVRKGEAIPKIDFHAPLLSLMTLLNVSEETIPRQVPYLHPVPDTAAAWAARLARSDGKLRVGLVWAGNPGHRNDANRSMVINHLGPMLTLPNVVFYSLQVGGDPEKTGPEARAKYPIIEDLAPELTNFGETAGALCALDLLISVDTGVAHLAGALARPVWMAVPFGPDWRWMIDRDDSPWYPTMKLYRQDSEGDWPGVITRMTEDLAELAG